MIRPFTHIAVPVDGSPASERGVQFALELAKGGGRLTFFSVVDPSLAFVPAGGAGIDPAPMISVLETNARRACTVGASEAHARGIPATSSVLFGDRTDALHEATKDGRADVIVIGTNGRTGVSRALFGSMTEDLLSHVEIPVVVVHTDDDIRSGPIAVAIDDSAAARRALDVAMELARAWSSRLDLVHITARTHVTPTASFVEDAAERLREAQIPFDLISCAGHPPEAIVDTADALDCSAIVIGTHGRSAVPRFFLGSVANAVLEKARLPVVVVRA